MKWIVKAVIVGSMTIFSVNAPSPIVVNKAYAGKMDGKPGGRNNADYRPSKYERAAKNSGKKNGMKP